MWPSSFGGFLRGGALCCPLARSRRSWTAVPRLGPALRRRHFGSNPRRFSRPRPLGLGCGCPWPHGLARMPRAPLLHLALLRHRTWELGGPRLVGRAPPEDPRAIGDLAPPSSSWGTSPLKPEPCSPLQRLWGGPSPSPPRALGKGAAMAAIQNLPNDLQQPMFFLQDLLVWSIKR